MTEKRHRGERLQPLPMFSIRNDFTTFHVGSMKGKYYHKYYRNLKGEKSLTGKEEVKLKKLVEITRLKRT